jgi:hypothetical protein
MNCRRDQTVIDSTSIPRIWLRIRPLMQIMMLSLAHLHLVNNDVDALQNSQPQSKSSYIKLSSKEL